MLKGLLVFLKRKGLLETVKKSVLTILDKPYLHKVPYYIHIELNNTCNFRCHMCPIHKMKRARKFMDFQVFKKIIDECSKVGIKRVRLFLMGEPLLHPKLIEFISYAKSKKLVVDFDSNAGYLDKIDQDALIRSGIDEIIFSVTGSKPSTYKKFQGGDLISIENKIKDFISLRNSIGSRTPHIHMQFIKSKDTESELSDYVSKWKPLSDAINITALNDYFDPKDKSKLTKTWCPYLWTFLVVLSDGTIVPCCQDYEGKMNLGNINEISLMDVWKSKKIKMYRKLHLSGNGDKISICKDCDVMYKK